jgi:ElaB/YqjD/DUF883 family membrane-anchored ribosome-binding protein
MADQSYTPTGTGGALDHLSETGKQGGQIAKDVANATGEKVEEARAKLNSALDTVRDTCAKLQERALASARATDKLVRDYPYPSLGVAFAAGLLIGVLLNRRA